MGWLSRSVGAAAFAGALAFGAQAQAAQLLFTLTGGYSATFLIDSNPTPDVSTWSTFTLIGVPGTFQDAEGPSANVTFFTDSRALELDNAPGGSALFAAYGLHLYFGSTTSPTIKTGAFLLRPYVPNNAGDTILRITEVTGGVPEPAAWALMLLGFGAAGACLRARRRGARQAAA